MFPGNENPHLGPSVETWEGGGGFGEERVEVRPAKAAG